MTVYFSYTLQLEIFENLKEMRKNIAIMNQYWTFESLGKLFYNTIVDTVKSSAESFGCIK